ncbi:RHS repeat-associated core domain-containing protein [Pseudomonas sp. nanlin1]|uniref:RHS repeat-associated core domain-containing protein n=1 Tax=Pseudomonas sp. nanlin1 TaxID=3040605 RepID=UPI00388FBB73
MTDASQTVLAREHDGPCEPLRYDPWGARAPTVGEGSAMGFNGEALERNVPLYLLGNGRRAYLPQLRRFSRPDPLSPFGIGQLNPYGYVLGDPVNLRDPTGLKPQHITAILSIVAHGLITLHSLVPVAIPLLLGRAIPRATQLGTAFGLAGSAMTITGSSMTLADHPDALLVTQIGTGLSITGSILKLPEAGAKLKAAIKDYKADRLAKAEQRRLELQMSPRTSTTSDLALSSERVTKDLVAASSQVATEMVLLPVNAATLAVGTVYNSGPAPEAAKDAMRMGPAPSERWSVASQARHIRRLGVGSGNRRKR